MPGEAGLRKIFLFIFRVTALAVLVEEREMLGM